MNKHGRRIVPARWDEEETTSQPRIRFGVFCFKKSLLLLHRCITSLLTITHISISMGPTMIYSRISKKIIFTIFISLICASSNGQTWRLAQPEGDAPGFTPGFGQHVYIRGQNSPGIQLTRAASAVTPTIVLTDSTYPGRSIKASPLIALAHDGSALVFWIDGDNQNDKAKWRARKISSNGEPQGDEILLPHIPTYGWWLDDWDRNSALASNGQQMVLVWAKFGDIYYQLFDFEANALTAPLQANQDTLKPLPFGGEWEPETHSPSVYMRTDGEFIIAWHDLRAAELVFDYDIFYPKRRCR